MGGAVTQAKKRMVPPRGTILVERRPTAVLRKQSWMVRLVASNGETIMSSEKYSRHIDARMAAEKVAEGKFEVVDDLEQM